MAVSLAFNNTLVQSLQSTIFSKNGDWVDTCDNLVDWLQSLPFTEAERMVLLAKLSAKADRYVVLPAATHHLSERWSVYINPKTCYIVETVLRKHWSSATRHSQAYRDGDDFKVVYYDKITLLGSFTDQASARPIFKYKDPLWTGWWQHMCLVHELKHFDTFKMPVKGLGGRNSYDTAQTACLVRDLFMKKALEETDVMFRRKKHLGRSIRDKEAFIKAVASVGAI